MFPVCIHRPTPGLFQTAEVLVTGAAGAAFSAPELQCVCLATATGEACRMPCRACWSALLCYVEHTLERSILAWLPSPSDRSSRCEGFMRLVSDGPQCLANLQRSPRLQHSMPPRASGRHCILASSPRAFSTPVPSALAAAHTY